MAEALYSAQGSGSLRHVANDESVRDINSRASPSRINCGSFAFCIESQLGSANCAGPVIAYSKA
jgi:hypothetical protein